MDDATDEIELYIKVADIIGVDHDEMRAADLPQERLSAIFDRAQKRKDLMDKISKYGVGYTGALTIPSFVAAAFYVAEGPWKTAMMAPLAVPVLFNMLSVMMEPSFESEREEVQKALVDKAIAFHKQAHLKPVI